ncbi:MAG: MerR family transcriptional regulator [Candidatus Binataceae bacterium]
MSAVKSSKTTAKRRKKTATDVAATSERPLKIGEAARVIGVEPYVLRFWETQFPILRPRHSSSKHRFYESRDIETLKLIKRLLHTEGFTIAGAKKLIKENGLDSLRTRAQPGEPGAAIANGQPHQDAPSHPAAHRMLKEIRNDLISLRKLLDERRSN